MGFIRKQEENIALKLLEWRYKQQQLPLPEKHVLRQHAADIVSEAHRVARQRGGNVVSILKDMISSNR
ncbi:MAG: hypothetical protein KGY61_10940 [Desulfobacterales bacterium]|nr:hypothetical protein [Desulfobacterales bacterium]